MKMWFLTLIESTASLFISAAGLAVLRYVANLSSKFLSFVIERDNSFCEILHLIRRNPQYESAKCS